MEKLKYKITNEIKGLDEYVKAMKKTYNQKGLLEDLDNLLLHISVLKAWAGIDVETSENSLHKHIVMGSIFDLPMECVPDPENDDTCERCRFEREDANSDICVYCRKNNAAGLYYP